MEAGGRGRQWVRASVTTTEEVHVSALPCFCKMWRSVSERREAGRGRVCGWGEGEGEGWLDCERLLSASVVVVVVVVSGRGGG